MPGKNIRPLAGKPLIAWSIEHAKAVKRIGRVLVSTDCQEIANVALEYGAEVPFMRPAELAGDTSAEWLAWQHALNYLQNIDGFLPDVMVSIPTTGPLRSPEDIENCINEFEKGDADVVVAITDAYRNPHFNMVKQNLDGTVCLVNPSQSEVSRRQDVPVVYDMTTLVYVANPTFVLSHQSIFAGRVQAVHVPVERAIDIDTLLDFEIAEFLMTKRAKKL